MSKIEPKQIAEAFELDADQVSEALPSIDHERIMQVQSERFSHGVWDKTTPINGATPQQIMDSKIPYPEGTQPFWVRDHHAGRVVYFQTVKPGRPGHQPMTNEEANEFGAKKAGELAERCALQLIADEIKKASSEG